MSSICQGTWDCQNCPKAVDNAIAHVIHPRGYHQPVRKCEENFILFLIRGEVLVNSQEYAGTMLRAGEFILQAIGSKFEMLAMTECECIYYRFIQPELFCDFRFNHIMKEVSSPLIYSPLKIIPELKYFLDGSKSYLSESKVCRDLLSLKRKELAFVLGYYYSDYDLAAILSVPCGVSSIMYSTNRYTNGCRRDVRKVFWTSCLIQTTVSLKYAINMALNLCHTSPISVRNSSVLLHAC